MPLARQGAMQTWQMPTDRRLTMRMRSQLSPLAAKPPHLAPPPDSESIPHASPAAEILDPAPLSPCFSPRPLLDPTPPTPCLPSCRGQVPRTREGELQQYCSLQPGLNLIIFNSERKGTRTARAVSGESGAEGLVCVDGEALQLVLQRAHPVVETERSDTWQPAAAQPPCLTCCHTSTRGTLSIKRF